MPFAARTKALGIVARGSTFQRPAVTIWLACLLASVAAEDALPAVAAEPSGNIQVAANKPTNLSGSIQFDIGSQPLPAALDAYSEASGVQVLYDGALAKGRMSSEIHGRLPTDAALSALLAGTGLAAVFTRTGNVVIVLNPVSPALNYMPPPVGPAMQLGEIHVDVPNARAGNGLYATLVQFQLEKVLRQAPNSITGNYQALLRIWLDPNGAVRRSQLVSSNGNIRGDENLLHLVQTLTVGAPPPPDLMQPVSIRVALSMR